MTLAEIRQRAREQAGDGCEPDARGDKRIDDYINEALNQLCAQMLPRDAQVVVKGGCLRLDEALAGYAQTLWLQQEDGTSAQHYVRHRRLYARDGRYLIGYLGCPNALEADADAPEIPEWFHGALADYATWRLLSAGGSASQARAQVFFVRFQMESEPYRKWVEGRMDRRRIRRKY